MKGSIPISSFHLAEGPGGFIEALSNVRKNPKDKYVGMTILDDKHDTNIPAWKKSEYFLRGNPNVSIENGATGTGDILCMENFKYCVGKYGSSMDLITADGGFDFSNDFNNQESNITKLLFGQICYAVCLQKQKGHFILKIFDCFMKHTVDLLYILSAFYEDVYITKPNTSRYANSEKYIVCKKFIFANNQGFIEKFTECFQTLLVCTDHISGFLSCPISNNFINKIEEYNAIFGQQQLDNIYQTIMLIDNTHKNDKIENYTRTNIQKCVNWCINHNVPHNTFLRTHDSGWD
jgi:23S rRNA U2552 (ribose-2'-O)-methylase RlmE/FtsJ